MINFHGITRYDFEVFAFMGEFFEDREDISIYLDCGDPGTRPKESPSQGPISCAYLKDTVRVRKST
jgi:hypothetical protein